MRHRCVLTAGVMVLLVGITSVVTAQEPAAPDPVDFRPFADGRNWIVKQPLKIG